MKSVLSHLVLKQDHWLSAVLNKEVFHAHVEGKGPLDESEVRHELRGKEFVDIKIPCHDILNLHTLFDSGFKVVDTNLTFSCEGSDDDSTDNIGHVVCRDAKNEDEDSIRKIAAENFIYSRFHLDPEIDKQFADKVKEEWVANFFRNERGEQMLVAEIGENLAGFCQLLKPNENQIIIDLIAVHKIFQRTGAAEMMIKKIRSSLGLQKELVVGTQAANIPSVRLYEKSQMRLLSSKYVLHYHGN